VADARAQLAAYPTVQWVDAIADKAIREADGFSVLTADGAAFSAQRLILALGVVDELPDVAGLAERWGMSVFHCPYCHGYELGQGEIGVLATSPLSLHQALMLPDWGPTTFFLNGMFAPDEAQLVQLDKRNVRIEREPIARLTGRELKVELRDGRVVPLQGLFTATRTRPSSDLAEQLGCAMEEGPLGPFITTDAFKETTAVGVFACGDAARAMSSVPLAVADGALAGVSLHRTLIFGQERPPATHQASPGEQHRVSHATHR
jgi:thioredoxin reductase